MTATRTVVEALVGRAPGPFVGGEYRARAERFEVRAPATGETLAAVGDADADDASAAVSAAAAALDAWSAMPAWRRYETLRAGVAELGAVAEDLAVLLSAETGKPLAEARGEVASTVRFFEWFGHETLRLTGEAWPDVAADRDALVLREPVGVVVAITPWNFPAFMVACKVGAALAAGCTVVLKPAEQTPLTALAIAAALHRGGLPAGVLNVLPAGDPRRVSDVLLHSAAVACVSFTGSRAVGEFIAREASSGIKRVLLELGGNAPAVVLEDADVGHAVEQVVRARFGNAGQTCVAANRVYVVDAVAEEFTSELVAATSRLRVGDPGDPDTDLGPLIDRAAVERVEEQIRTAVAQGARLLTGGGRIRETAESVFLRPAVLAASSGAQPAVFAEELFGPVLAVVRCPDAQTAVALANDTEYGLAGYVFSADQRRALAVARRLAVGSVGVNCALVSEPALPFGGVKASGIGRERGRAGVEEFLDTKTVQISTATREPVRAFPSFVQEQQ
ncbi:aldehyde dehydrogenase family protein [Streptomyces sp. NPDC004629]|uniref:aldehyde dehydrogenase family protein n=1 Tax=Streptomyces sp. NPDC004629 TaxID=3364705 RepID=UPI00367C47C8